MNRKLLAVGLAIVLATVPVSVADHLSVGYDDTLGTSADETPEDKSVLDEEHAIGVSEDCYEPDSNLSTEGVLEAQEASAFCGDLIYGAGTNFTQTGPVDQDFHADEIGTFDVQLVTLVGNGLLTCYPFCPSDTQPGGDEVWHALHDTGETLGLTDNGEDAEEAESSDRWQEYSAMVRFAEAGEVIQSETGAWEMNGWLSPSPAHSFVAFLEDGQGNPIDEQRLETLVNATYAGDLTEGTAASVCGWTPDADFTSSGQQTNCEVEFRYSGPGSSDGEFKGYDDKCESPTYVCGAFAGGHWSASGFGPTYGGHEQLDYFTWHWVVGSHQSACDGAAEPGVGFGTPEDASMPYLAHDLDVYTPTTATANEDTRVSPLGTVQYADAVGANALNQVFDEADPLLEEAFDQTGEAISTLPGLPPEAGQAVNDTFNETNAVLGTAFNETNEAIGVAIDASWLVLKSHRMEPNNAVPVGDDALDDDSQSDIVLDRTLGGECDIVESIETPETADPWVNYLDGELVKSYGAIGWFPATYYGNSETHQNEDNTPGPGAYWTTGMVGMFADKNDDGAYDDLASDQKHQGDEIKAVGAYDMMWDMWVDDNGDIDTSGGCATISDTPFAKLMKDAGYGPNTGLVQALYLREPATFYDVISADAIPYTEGHNIYLMMSQGAKTLYNLDEANDMTAEIDKLVENLKDYAEATGELPRSEIDVIQPGTELGLRSDYGSQCAQSTGGFQGSLQFTHDCTMDCSGDTIATMYTFDVDDAPLGGGEIPTLTVNGTSFPPAEEGQYTWYDIDPFDGDPERNSEESSSPPT